MTPASKLTRPVSGEDGEMLLQLCFSEGVEQCVPWAENTTQQIDLAFNIFFMVYFFIRVRSLIEETVISRI